MYSNSQEKCSNKTYDVQTKPNHKKLDNIASRNIQTKHFCVMQAYSVVDDDREIFYEKRKAALVVVQRRREVGLKCKSREI